MTGSVTERPTGQRPDHRDALPRLDRHKPKGGPVRKSNKGRWRAMVLIGVHVVAAIHIAHWMSTGSSITPVEPSEAMETLELGYVNAGFILFALLILSTLVLGRWFCGWACHVVALQDLCAWLLGRLGLRPKPVRSRLLILVPFFAAFYMFAVPSLPAGLQEAWNAVVPGSLETRIHQGAAPDWDWQLTTDDMWRTFPGLWMALATFLVCGFLIVWWLGAKGFCTYGCPYGGVFALVERFAPARIRVTDACEHCGHCTTVCTSNVRVHEEVAKHGMVVDPGCMKCLDCVTVCPKDALYFGFGKVKPFQVSQQRRAARADFTWGEELALAALFLLGLILWRGLWVIEPVPLLMSFGLSAITAAVLLLGWRLLRRRHLLFQHTVLKTDGRLTGRGRLVAGLVAAFAFLMVWLGAADWFHEHATDAARALREPAATEAEAVERLATAEAAAARAVWWSPGRDPRLLELHGLLLRDLERHGEAELLLREAVARVRSPAFVARGAMALAIYHNWRGEYDEALRLARAVLERSPNNATARSIVERLGGR